MLYFFLYLIHYLNDVGKSGENRNKWKYVFSRQTWTSDVEEAYSMINRKWNGSLVRRKLRAANKIKHYRADLNHNGELNSLRYNCSLYSIWYLNPVVY